jgi:hypothetical protein
MAMIVALISPIGLTSDPVSSFYAIFTEKRDKNLAGLPGLFH